MAYHADAIAARLQDTESCVRQAAAVALGCLGRRGAVRYQRQLLALLTDDSNHVRYASLVTLGGLLATARPHSATIARHLNDEDARCRMAALRALKCMGAAAAPYIEDLREWQQRWFNQDPNHCPQSEKKREPITTRAMLFPDVPLKDLFRGHAPLGKRFAGAVVTQKARKEMLRIALRRPSEYYYGDGDDDNATVVVADLEATRDKRAEYVAAQARHREADAVRRQQHKQQCALRRISWQAVVEKARDKFRPNRHRSSCFRRIGHGRRERSSEVCIEGGANEWVISVCRYGRS